MDILAARKRAAERAKVKGQVNEPAPPLPEETAPVCEAAGASEPAPAREPEQPLSEPSAAGQGTTVSSPASAAVGEPSGSVIADQEPDETAEAAAAEAETLAFRLGSEDYLVPVEKVKEVLKLREATPVPHAPEYVPGVVSLRGTVLPVIDLSRRLGIPGGSRDDKSRIIVVGLDDEDAGLIVDRVKGVVRFPPDAVQPAPETLEQGAEFLKGIVRKEGKLYILLDLEKAVGV